MRKHGPSPIPITNGSRREDADAATFGSWVDFDLGWGIAEKSFISGGSQKQEGTSIRKAGEGKTQGGHAQTSKKVRGDRRVRKDSERGTSLIWGGASDWENVKVSQAWERMRKGVNSSGHGTGKSMP